MARQSAKRGVAFRSVRRWMNKSRLSGWNNPERSRSAATTLASSAAKRGSSPVNSGMAIGMGFRVPCVMSTSRGPLGRCGGACPARCWACAGQAVSAPTSSPAATAASQARERGRGREWKLAPAMLMAPAAPGAGSRVEAAADKHIKVTFIAAGKTGWADSTCSRLEHVARVEVENDILPEVILGRRQAVGFAGLNRTHGTVPHRQEVGRVLRVHDLRFARQGAIRIEAQTDLDLGVLRRFAAA